MPSLIKNFPEQELLEFHQRLGYAVYKARRNARRLSQTKANGEDRYKEIRQCLQQYYPTARIHFFGSRALGLGTFWSDLDVYIEIGDSFYKGADRKVAERLVKDITTKLSKNNNWDVQKGITDSTIPVLRCYSNIPRRLKCDIVFSDGLGVVTTRLTAYLLNLQPQQQGLKLYHAVRMWLRIVGVELKLFQIQILVIFFLQQQDFLPSIEQVQKGVKRRSIGNWNVQYDPNRSLKDYKLKTMDNFKKYLPRFFWLYANIDYNKYVIFPYYGKSVMKQNYPEQEDLKKFRADLTAFKWEKPLAMAGLVSINYNVAWDVGKDRLHKFMECCRLSFELLDPY